MKKSFYLLVIFTVSMLFACTGIYENGKEMAAEAKTVINEISVEDLKTKLESEEPFLLLDVRMLSEFEKGYINEDFDYSMFLEPVNLPRGILEFQIASEGFWEDYAEEMPDKDSTEIIIYCKSGARGILSAKTLLILGYKNVKNLTGGWKAWNSDPNAPVKKEEDSGCGG